MKARDAVRAGVGVALCVAGFVLARASPYRETTVIVDAGDCRMVTDIVDAGNDAQEGSVVLLHGVVANKKIMSYLAQAFAEQNLRVFVPDLPGHGRTPGPFSFARAEACSESLVRQLLARRAIDPARTILVGHSMGGAIAVRVAARVSAAGVIAISPAPMSTARGVPADMLPYTNSPPTPANTLVVSGSWEPAAMRDSARDLVAGGAETTGKFVLLSRATHVSLLFDPRVARASQEWAAGLLHLAPRAGLPSRLPLAGSLAGLLGLFLLAGPFLREFVGTKTMIAATGGTVPADESRDEAFPLTLRSAGRSCVEIAAASVVVVLLLRFWIPLRFIHVFEGDYLASFLLILGGALFLWHRKSVGIVFRSKLSPLLSAACAAIVLHLLIYAWFDLTITEAWLTPVRWLRFPAMLAAVLPYHAAEEFLLGQVTARSARVRLLLALVFRFIAWSALLLGIFLLHNGQILLVLLAPYFGVFCLLQRMGMDVVRRDTGSPMAAALFGAILLTGFSLVIFPIT